MKLPFLAIVLLFVIILAFGIQRSNRKMAKSEKNFWDREHDANFSRKKSLENIDYISITDDVKNLVGCLLDDSNCSEISESLQNIVSLYGKKIFNLNGISNTDVKLRYGAANITPLSEYDENYTILITSLNSVGVFLADNNRSSDAEIILDYATSIGSDIPSSYTILANIFKDTGRGELLHLLIKRAESAHSFRSETIIKSLTEILDTVS